LDGSTELLKNLAGNIQTLRSRMTPEELEAQHALTVAEKRVERLQRVAETVQKGVSGGFSWRIVGKALVNPRLCIFVSRGSQLTRVLLPVVAGRDAGAAGRGRGRQWGRERD
jgi:hypothetical protein